MRNNEHTGGCMLPIAAMAIRHKYPVHTVFKKVLVELEDPLNNIVFPITKEQCRDAS